MAAHGGSIPDTGGAAIPGAQAGPVPSGSDGAPPHRPGPGLSLLPPCRVSYSASALSSARMMFREIPIETSWMIPMMSSA